jgi:NADPH2:quinone reductase
LTTTTVNPHDQRTRDLGLFVTSTPYVLGSDLVGEVLTIGAGDYPAKFAVGEHVFGHTMAQGGWDSDFNGAQQYALVDARYVGRVAASGLSDDAASTIPVVALAAFVALFASSGLGFPAPFAPEALSFDYGGVTLLVIGGGSSTGRATVEFAKLVGIGRIIVVAGSRNEARLRSIGATHVIDRGDPDALGRIRALTGDELFYAIDTVNAGEEQELGVAALSNVRKGTLVTLRRPERDFDAARIGPKFAGYDRRLVFGVSPLHPEVTTGFWEWIPRWLKDGAIRPVAFEVVKGLDAAAVNKALDRYRDGAGVKTNIHPWG